MSNEPEAVTFVVPGDLHLTVPGLPNHRAAEWMIDEVNELIRPDFVQFIGDNVQDATEEEFALFDALRSRLEVPHFALVGDHDVHDDPTAGRFRAHVGSTTGSTSLRGVRFLRLDTQQARPLGIGECQANWLRAEVDEAIAADERVVLFQHNYPYQIWETFDGPGIDLWREVVQTRRIEAIVCGHTHYWQVANDGRNVMVATRSIGDPEGGPAGYMVGHIRDEELAFAYRSIEDRGPLVMVTHPRESILATAPAHVLTGRDCVRARVWSRGGVQSVRFRADSRCWIVMEEQQPGEWSGPLAAELLAKGEHVLEIQAIDADGLQDFRTMRFFVDPTGRYTAVPRVHPAVDRTEFC